MNRLREALRQKAPLLGIGVTLNDMQVTEALGSLFDFVWIDMEHTGMSCEQARSHLIAARAAGCAAAVRIACNDPVLAKPVLDMLPDAVVFPQVGNLEDARKAIAACYYSPRGNRGWGPLRAQRYGLADAQTLLDAEDDTAFPILQIENQAFMADLDAILALPRLGAVCVGPCDLSGSLNKLCQLRDTELLTQFDAIAAAAQRQGVPLMVSMGFDPQAVAEWIARGARILQVGSDLGCMVAEAARMLAAMQTLH